MAIEKTDFLNYLDQLGQSSGIAPIRNIEDLQSALLRRLDYFVEAGCRISDHSLDDEMFSTADPGKADRVFRKSLQGIVPTKSERRCYKGYLLSFLGKAYAERQMIMQLHIGAIRNNSDRMFNDFGADAGSDSMNDFNYAEQLSGLLNEMDRSEQLPKMILYNLNSKDKDMLVTMLGNFQSGGQRGKLQYGPAWWFLDHKAGIREQLEALAANGLIANFVGMVTDSRSFLSFSRHEYFRRILCNYFGDLIENGEYPADMEFVGSIVQDICYNNIKRFLFE